LLFIKLYICDCRVRPYAIAHSAIRPYTTVVQLRIWSTDVSPLITYHFCTISVYGSRARSLYISFFSVNGRLRSCIFDLGGCSSKINKITLIVIPVPQKLKQMHAPLGAHKPKTCSSPLAASAPNICSCPLGAHTPNGSFLPTRSTHVQDDC
jgi:hypothetical protein